MQGYQSVHQSVRDNQPGLQVRLTSGICNRALGGAGMAEFHTIASNCSDRHIGLFQLTDLHCLVFSTPDFLD